MPRLPDKWNSGGSHATPGTGKPSLEDVVRTLTEEVGDPAYTTATAWYIDPINGNDTAEGSELFPLQTLSELARRWQGQIINVPVTVHIIADLPATDYPRFRFNVGEEGRVLFKGHKTLVATGTLTAVTDRDPASNQQNEVTDTGLADTWTALGYVELLIMTTSGVNSGASAWVAKDLGTSAARVSSWLEDTTVDTAVEWDGKPANVDADVGDEYSLYTLPDINDLDFDVHIVGDWGAGWASAKVWFEDISINAAEDRYIRLRVSGDFYAFHFNRCRIGRVQPGMGASIRYCGCKITQPFFGYQISADIIGGFCTSYACVYPTSSVIFRRSVLVHGGIYVQGGAIELCGNGVGVFETGSYPGIDLISAGVFSYATYPAAVVYGDADTGVGVRVRAGCRFIYPAGNKPTITGTAGDALVGGIAKAWADVPFFDTTNGAALVESS